MLRIPSPRFQRPQPLPKRLGFSRTPRIPLIVARFGSGVVVLSHIGTVEPSPLGRIIRGFCGGNAFSRVSWELKVVNRRRISLCDFINPSTVALSYYGVGECSFFASLIWKKRVSWGEVGACFVMVLYIVVVVVVLFWVVVQMGVVSVVLQSELEFHLSNPQIQICIKE